MAGMPHFSYTRRVQLACVLAPFALITGRLWASSGTVVISQVYTAGGNSGATYNADYVEIFNLSNAPVSLNGYALQYFSATASATSTPVVSTLPAGVTLQPGQRYLVEATPSPRAASPRPMRPTTSPPTSRWAPPPAAFT